MSLLVTTALFALVLAARRFFRTGDYSYAFIAGLLVFGLFDGMMESGMVSPIFTTFLAATGVVHAACFARSASAQRVSQPAAPAGT
jgi:hypothetical protein